MAILAFLSDVSILKFAIFLLRVNVDAVVNSGIFTNLDTYYHKVGWLPQRGMTSRGSLIAPSGAIIAPEGTEAT